MERGVWKRREVRAARSAAGQNGSPRRWLFAVPRVRQIRQGQQRMAILGDGHTLANGSRLPCGDNIAATIPVATKVRTSSTLSRSLKVIGRLAAARVFSSFVSIVSSRSYCVAPRASSRRITGLQR